MKFSILNSVKEIRFALLISLSLLIIPLTYGQFGNTHMEIVDVNKAMAELNAKMAEEQRIKKHNEWVNAEKARLNTGKNIGIALMVIGVIISGISIPMIRANSIKNSF